MSPEAKRSFEAEWAVLSRRLRLLLARKRVAPAQHDDLLQETALRLVSMWDSVDRRRELWPLTVTIALNLLRDRDRVISKDELVGEMPELRALTDVETAGIARIELSKVREAMDQLSASHRAILMKEIGSHTGAALPDAAGDKMLRMRARRKLRSALEKVSGLVALRIRRLGDLLEGLVVLRETGITAASCAICLALGVGGAIVPPPSITPPASAAPAGRVSQFGPAASTGSRAAGDVEDSGLRRAVAEARASGSHARVAEAHESSGRKATRGRSAKVKSGRAPSSDGGLLGAFPVGHGGDAPQGAPEITVAAEGEGPRPPLPGGGEDGPPAPPIPPAPGPPPPPPDDSADDPLGGAAELVEQVL